MGRMELFFFFFLTWTVIGTRDSANGGVRRPGNTEGSEVRAEDAHVRSQRRGSVDTPLRFPVFALSGGGGAISEHQSDRACLPADQWEPEALSGLEGREAANGGRGAVRVSAHRDGGGAVGPGPGPWLSGERHAVASGVTSPWREVRCDRAFLAGHC